MKRVLSFILVLSMILGSIGMAFAAPSEANQSAIDEMVELGFVQGDEGGLRLDETITRAELAVIATRMAGLEDVALKSNYQGGFSDVTPDMWDNPVMNGAINVAAGQGLVKGYPDGTFQPGNDITNAEAITLMVRMVVSAEEAAKLDAGVWPAAYITKAAELGLLEGANIANYQAAAVREAVFVIGYNAHSVKADEDLEVVKAIVLENDRVESIGKGEVVVEIIKEVQRASFTEESRKKEGDQLRLTIPSELGDVEDLLGKVVDLVSDKNGLVNVVVDDSYEVVAGAITAEKSKLSVGTKSYTVSLDERYDKNDERVFRTYLNNKPYKYEDFYQDVTRDRGVRAAEEFKADYARVTIKNGKVLFIDSFKFEDIAPVKEVKENGAEVFVYNDAKDGGVKKFELKASTQVVAVENGVFSEATREDIEVNDVVHYYENGYIVRKDALVNGTFEKVSEDNKGKIFVHVDEEKYEVSTAANKKPVYSYDSGDFYTLNANTADSVLKEFRRERVTVLQDISGNLQYIGSEIELGEFVGIVTRVVGRDLRVLKTNGKTEDYVATLDTKVDGITGHQSLNTLKPGNLVYLSVDGDKIEKVTELVQSYKARGVNGATLTVGNVADEKVNFFDAKDIKFDAEIADNDGKEFRILADTNIFVIDTDKDSYEVRTAKDIKDAFEKNQKDGKEVRAYAISGERFVRVVDPRRDVYTSRKGEAHTIVFTQLDIKADLDTKIVEFNGFADRQEREMDVIYADGSKETLPVARNIDMPARLRGGDILEIKVTKDDKSEIKEVVSRLIEAADKGAVFAVRTIDRHGNLELIDRHGAKETFYVETKTEVFGNLGNAERVSYVLDGDTKYLKAVLVRAKNDRVTGSFDTAGDISGAVSIDRYYATTGTVVIDDRRYEVDSSVTGMRGFFAENDIEAYRVAVEIDEGKIVSIRGIVVEKDNATIDGKNVTVKGNIIVNGNGVTIKDIIAEEIYQYKETLTLDNVEATLVEINAKGPDTLTLKGSTKVATVNVNKPHTVNVEGSAEVTKEILVNAKAEGTKIQGDGEIAKVVVKAADVVVPAGVTVEVDKSVEPEITDASVTSAVYDEDEGKYKVTFTVKTKNATNVKLTEGQGFNYGDGENPITVDKNGKVEFVISVDKPRNLEAKFVAVYTLAEDAKQESDEVVVEFKEDKFPKTEK